LGDGTDGGDFAVRASGEELFVMLASLTEGK
jgi:hypothetical protein